VDTVKSRYMTDVKYNSARQCFQIAMKDSGISGLYRGLPFVLARSFLVNGAGGLGISALKQVLGLD